MDYKMQSLMSIVVPLEFYLDLYSLELQQVLVAVSTTPFPDG
jgi:hypothetical protein